MKSRPKSFSSRKCLPSKIEATAPTNPNSFFRPLSAAAAAAVSASEARSQTTSDSPFARLILISTPSTVASGTPAMISRMRAEQVVDAVRDEVAPVDGDERGLLAGLVVDELDLAVLPEDPQPDLVPVAPDLRRRRQRQVRERPLQLARQDLRDLLSLDVDLERVVHVLVGRAGEIVAAPRLDPRRRPLDDPDRPRLGVAPAVLEDLDLDGLARQPPVRENHLAFEESHPPARVDDLLDADQHGFLTRLRAPPIAMGTNDTP